MAEQACAAKDCRLSTQAKLRPSKNHLPMRLEDLGYWQQAMWAGLPQIYMTNLAIRWKLIAFRKLKKCIKKENRITYNYNRSKDHQNLIIRIHKTGVRSKTPKRFISNM